MSAAMEFEEAEENASEMEREIEKVFSILREQSSEERTTAQPSEELLSSKVHRILSQHSSARSDHGGEFDLNDSLEDIADVHALINDALRKEYSPVYAAFAQVRDVIGQVFGRETNPYSPEELFERQLRNLRRLNTRLSRYGSSTEESLHSLTTYQEETRAALVSDCQDYRTLHQGLRMIAEQYEEQPQVLGGKGREVRELLSRQSLLGQRIVFRHREMDLLTKYEEVMSGAAHFSTLVCQNVSLVVEHVEQTKQLYHQFGSQFFTVQDLMSATELLGDYLNQLNSTVAENALSLSQQASTAYHAGAFPQVVGAALDGTIGQLRDAEFRHHQDIEQLVATILDEPIA